MSTDEAVWTKKSFDAFDEQDLAIILTQVARRMLKLRITTPDIGFWHGTLLRISKMLAASPNLTDEEIKLVVKLKSKQQSMIPAIRMVRQRTGMRLRPSHDLIKAWVNTNFKDSITKPTV